MAGVVVEDALEPWTCSLREVKRPERRKTGWMRAEAADDRGPWRQQAILGHGRWDADALRDLVREYVVESLADADAVLVLDETGFLKQGKGSCGGPARATCSASTAPTSSTPGATSH